MDIRSQLLAAVERSRLSERKLSQLATGSSDTIRNVRRGAAPRVDTLEALCRTLGLEVRIRPGPLPPYEDTLPRTEFTGSRELPIHELTEPSEKGYLRGPEDPDRAPAPSDLSDEQAFYLRMPDHSMVPARIAMNSLCLVYPLDQLQVDHRAWFRDRTGRETIRWVMRISADGFDLGAWDLDEGGHAKPAAVHWRLEDVVGRGVVVAVYREKPVATQTLEPVAKWRPDPASELWRAGLFSDAIRELARKLDETVSALEETDRLIRLRAETGEISEFHATQILRVLDDRLQNTLSAMRSSVIGRLPDESEDSPEQ